MNIGFMSVLIFFAQNHQFFPDKAGKKFIDFLCNSSRIPLTGFRGILWLLNITESVQTNGKEFIITKVHLKLITASLISTSSSTWPGAGCSFSFHENIQWLAGISVDGIAGRADHLLFLAVMGPLLELAGQH